MNRAWSNIRDLIRHVNSFSQEIFLTAPMEESGKKAVDVMRDNVIRRYRSSNFDDQSGRFKFELESALGDVKQNKKSLEVGFAEVETLSLEKRSYQKAMFISSNGVINVNLKPEKELPKWIIIEFGRKPMGEGTSKIPAMFLKEISYTPRPNKENMVGPSMTKHYRKPVFFMAKNGDTDGYGRPHKINQKPRKHPGIKGAKIFRKGLEDSKYEIYSIFQKGVAESLTQLSKKYGGEVGQ